MERRCLLCPLGWLQGSLGQTCRFEGKQVSKHHNAVAPAERGIPLTVPGGCQEQMQLLRTLLRSLCSMLPVACSSNADTTLCHPAGCICSAADMKQAACCMRRSGRICRLHQSFAACMTSSFEMLAALSALSHHLPIRCYRACGRRTYLVFGAPPRFRCNVRQAAACLTAKLHSVYTQRVYPCITCARTTAHKSYHDLTGEWHWLRVVELSSSVAARRCSEHSACHQRGVAIWCKPSCIQCKFE